MPTPHSHTPNIHYGAVWQISLISQLISDPSAWAVCGSHFKHEYFDDQIKPAVIFISKYQKEYGQMPATEQISAGAYGTNIPKFSEPCAHTESTINDFEEFVRYRATENAALDAIPMLQEGRGDMILERVQAANDLRVRDDDQAYDGLWIDECEKVEPPEYLIPNFLVKDNVTCLFGEPGSYKSFLGLEAGFCLAAGIPFAGKQVQRTSVAYVAAEGQRGLAIRLEALKQRHGMCPDRTSFRLITQPVNLLDDDAVEKWIKYIERLEKQHSVDFGVVFLDTYSQMISGADENAQAVASKASTSMIKIRARLETTVVYVHHTGKDKSRGMRGSDTLRANTDGAIEVELDDDKKGATAIVRRSKDAPGGERLRFKAEFQKVPRLAGRALDGSMVLQFVTEQPIVGVQLPMQGRTISWLEDLLNQMSKGQVCSIARACALTNRPCNSYYKRKLCEVLPMDMQIDVPDADGDIVGQLVRSKGSRADNEYGDVKCLSKAATDEAESGEQANSLLEKDCFVPSVP